MSFRFLTKTRIIPGCLLAAILLYLLYLMVGDVIFFSSTSKDELVNPCDKVSILVPAKWTIPRYDQENCGISSEAVKYYFFKMQVPRWGVVYPAVLRGRTWHNHMADTSGNVFPSDPKLMYERFFARPDKSPQDYYELLARDGMTFKGEIINYQTEYRQINGLQVFIVSYTIKSLPKSYYYWIDFLKTAYYYHPEFAYYVATSCPEEYRAEYEPVFDRIINSVQFNEALLAPPAGKQ